MSPDTFTYTLTVPATAIDVMGHVNNVVYVDWVQTAASHHWNANTKDYFKDFDLKAERIGIERMAWVVLDHYIQYKAAALEGDEIAVTTFVKSFQGAKSERHTEIKRVSDGKLLVTAVTNWCLLKMPEGRPMRVPKEILDLF